ncbi:hypothetical protein QR98_0052570 [Sarcoptes scabiei]|nr:hypothetical protein QR98_0052570 [Sarcoptes scabiei]
MWKLHKSSAHSDNQITSSKKRKYSSSSDDELKDDERSKSKSKNYWLQKLDSFESKQPERWDHNGFKELYPEKFVKKKSSKHKKKSKSEKLKHKKKSKHKKSKDKT